MGLFSNLTFAGVFYAIAGFVMFVTAWGKLPFTHWIVRVVDFPRIQFIFLGLTAWVGLFFSIDDFATWQWLFMVMLTLAILAQAHMVLPYTLIWKKEVKQATQRDPKHQVRLMISNVLTPNDQIQKLIDLVKKEHPDLLITLETDHKWQHALSVIEPDYPHTVKVPLDNLYGMHLYSKFELINPQVRYLVVDDIPSIHTQIKLHNDKIIWLYCLHPMPPSPTEATKSATRDAELLLVGKHIKQHQQIAILAGDLNDVAWSRTTRMFQRISGLLDPRIGRQFNNTFHAKYPLFRWALDHVFHSSYFTLVENRRLPSVGSDHFPVLTVLQYEPEVAIEQQKNAPIANTEDKQDAEECIEEGLEEGKRLSNEHRQEM